MATTDFGEPQVSVIWPILLSILYDTLYAEDTQFYLSMECKNLNNFKTYIGAWYWPEHKCLKESSLF